MGAFNVLRAEATCPQCGNSPEVEVQFKYGSTWQREYAIGDVLSWGKNDIGEPTHERVVADGAAGPCPSCGYDGDWDLDIFIERDRITRVEPRSGRYDFVTNGRTYVVLDK
jgi:hypothetical protein